MNNIFNAKRFGRYFASDLKLIWSNFGLSFSILSFSSIIIYFIWVVFNISITGDWDGPNTVFKYGAFVITLLILLVQMQSKCYGFITEKRAGSSWLMLPVSSFEKFLSIILYMIIIPILFLVLYIGTDSLISLLVPGSDISLINSLNLGEIEMKLREVSEIFSISKITISGIIGILLFIFFFLLGAIYFKTSKIGKTILTYFVGSCVISMATTPFLIDKISDMSTIDAHVDETVNNVVSLVNWGLIANSLMLIALLTVIYLRIRTIKH